VDMNESTSAGSTQVAPPDPPGLRVREGQVEIAHDALQTWKTYVIRAQEPVFHPATGAVGIVRSDADVTLVSTGGWMGELRVHSGGHWYTLRISEPKLSSVSWHNLLDDLADAIAALPLTELTEGSSLEQVPTGSTPWVQRLVLRAYADQIARGIDAIQRHPHEALRTDDVWVTPDRATVATPAGVVAMLERGAFVTTGPVAERLGGIAPTAWREPRKEIRTDTPENRFARHVVETVISIAHRFPDDDRLRDLVPLGRSALARAPLRDAGPYRRFPAASRVLQRRHGYRELRDAYFALLGSGRVVWDGLEDTFRGGLRDTPTLYQYWCFLALQRQLGVERPRLPYRASRSKLHVELEEGLTSSVATPRGRLWHERTFARPLGAYSVDLRPDFALERVDGGIDLFDAKFRIRDQGDAKHDDLTKMHAYRDAIRDCHSARVLYPGEREEYYAAHDDGPEDDPSGIGVLPMQP